MLPKRLLIPVCGMCIFFCFTAAAQQATTSLDKVLDFPSSFFTSIQTKYSYIEKRIAHQTKLYLKRLSKQEKRLKRKLQKMDSAAAAKLFGNVDDRYNKLTLKWNAEGERALKRSGSQYVPVVDSIKTSLSFLQQNNSLVAGNEAMQETVKSSLNSINQLQSKLQQTEEIKEFIKTRKQQIKEGFSKYTGLPKSISGAVAGFNKQAYYYNQQVNEYRQMLKEPGRMVQKGLSLLNKLPAFKDFMKQHSELASLFRLPDNYGTSQSLVGLQTRAQVQQQIQTQLAAAGPNAQQYLQQNLQAAQAQLNKLKDKFLNSPSTGGGRGEADPPDFKPNNQKTKTFWQRLEYGSNFQTVKSNFFPVTTDLGLSVGYKLSDKSTIGIGASYKMGWGKDFRHISITHEGLGLRSFLDMKLKGSFYASGGFEYNYQPLTIAVASSPPTGGEAASWSKSGLIGVSKIVSVKSRFFKKTKLQLLWDFMSYQQVPRTQPVKFRVGYNF